jgi:hypothetical protein
MGIGFYIGLFAVLISILGLILDYHYTTTSMTVGFYVGAVGAVSSGIGLLVDYMLHCKGCCDDKNK